MGKAVLTITAMLGLALGVAEKTQAQSAAGPTFSPTGPSAEAYGAAKGYPVPPKGGPTLNVAQEFLVGLHSHYDQVRPVRNVPTSGPPSLLKRAAKPIAPIYAYDGRIKTIHDYLAEHPATGLLIARDDTILFEHYQYARSDRDRFASWSMAKTVLGMLVGIAVAEGAIASIDDLAAKYVPELQGSEFGSTPIRALLQMSSGIAFLETYQPGDDSSKLVAGLFAPEGPIAAVRQFDTRVAPPGRRFNYSSTDSEVLGLVLRRAVGMPLTEFF